MWRLLQDLRYAVRQSRKHPAFTAVSLLTFALAIGAVTAIFSELDAILLRPLPYPNPSRLMWLTNYVPPKDYLVGAPDFLVWRNQNCSFLALAAYDDGDSNLSGHDRSQRTHFARVTSSFFTTLGVQPEFGRAFRKDEDVPGAPNVAILSNRLWQRSFGGNASAVEDTIKLDGVTYDIVGVMPVSFVFPKDGHEPDVLLPLALEQHVDMATQAIPTVSVIGRLRSGIKINQALAEVSAIETRFEQTYPPGLKNMTLGMQTEVVPLQQYLAGQSPHTIFILLAAAAFLAARVRQRREFATG